MSKGDHKQDPLGRTPGLVEGEPWYTTTSKDYLSPSLTEPELEPDPEPARPKDRQPGRHRKSGKPHKREREREPRERRRVNPRYVTAGVFTALLAIPSLWMADYIATHDATATQIQLSQERQAHIPMTLYSGQARVAICVYITDAPSGWKAYATNQSC